MSRLRSIVNRIPKRATSSILMLSMAVFAFGSMGGGGNKSKSKAVKGADFVPIRTTNGFTLKSGPYYRGSMVFGQEKTKNIISFNTVVTYQKGNTTFILPYRYKVQTTNFDARSSLQTLNFKVNLHK